MADEDGFLSRWSRRAQEAKRRQDAHGVKAEPAPEASPPVPSPPPADAPVAEPEFDIASLPALEDVSIETDISVFLQNGVPEALKNAALRKAWALDPLIRDYIGPVENGWDFNDPESIPGFGYLKPDFDAQAMMRRITGEKSPQEILDAVTRTADGAAPEQNQGQVEGGDDAGHELVSARISGGKPDTREGNETEIRHSNHVATQHDPVESIEQNMHFPNKRRHGGALPD